MDTYVTTQEKNVTEIEERIETQRERSEIMRRQLACEQRSSDAARVAFATSSG